MTIPGETADRSAARRHPVVRNENQQGIAFAIKSRLLDSNSGNRNKKRRGFKILSSVRSAKASVHASRTTKGVTIYETRFYLS
jgi:hypothetical protein